MVGVTSRLLNAIYEQDFLDCSYGFRPKRWQHQALDEIGRIICTRPIAWVLEIDIRSYFDSIVRSALVGMIEKRVIDGSVLRLIGNFQQIKERFPLLRPKLHLPYGALQALATTL